ncbi:MAG TPA: SPOR domain-containing protein [Usitatibacteraceae bacterium]|nr:SPOR domain-containing protein [Usitatibacteraceae bacterium]
MQGNPTSEQAELRRKGRQRLIGAVAIALIAVVFVPMLLDPEPRRERVEPPLAIPPKDGVPPLAPAARLPEPAVQPETAKVAPADAPAPPVKQEAKSVPSSPPLEGFAVQVGAFKEDAKLAQARDKVAAARLAHYTERLAGASGELTRLRAGPFPTREAADKAAAQLKRAGLDARVVTLP